MMTTKSDACRAYVERCLDHLRRQYTERMPLPSGEEMSLNLLQRLYRCVIAEYQEG